MEADCSFCKRTTKYSCLNCSTPVCNVCSISAAPGRNGYDEEAKKIGICKTCEEKKSDEALQPEKKKPKTLLSMMKRMPIQPGKATQGKASSSSSSSQPKLPATSATARTVTPATVKKWMSELAKYNASEWLTYEVDKAGKARNLKCKFCTEYEPQIKKMPFFSNAFIIGSKNYKKSAVEEHAVNSKPHQRAYELHLKAKNVPLDERANSLSAASANSSSIVKGIATMDKKDQERTKRKFEVAYMVAKTKAPMTLYPHILNLEKMHGVDMGTSYESDMACGEFIDFIGRDLQQQLNKDLSKAKFFSVLCDGSTDSAVLENEIVYVLYFDPEPANSDSVEVKTSFLKVNYLDHQHAEGVAKAINDSFQEILAVRESIESGFASLGITSLEKKLIGFTSDGASVNKGDTKSVKRILQEKSPWLVFVWCMAHRLELALSDALKNTQFDDVDNMLLRMFYMYHKAPKKLRELKEIHELYKESMTFDEGGIKPPKASGTRWISHKLKAMKTCLDKWGIYIQHLESLCEDKTIKSQDRAKLKGYLQQWRKSKMPILLAFFIDLLEIPSRLSLALQKEEIDTVYAAMSLQKTGERFDMFERKDFDKLPHVKHFLSKVTTSDTRKVYYQGIELVNYESELSRARQSKNDLLKKVRDCIEKRIEQNEESSSLLRHAVQILQTDGWKRETRDDTGAVSEDKEFADESIRFVFDHFAEPLSHAGVNDEVEALRQWHDLLDYACEFLSPGVTPCRMLWRRIFSSPRSKESWSAILTVVELLFTLPISNAKLERMFSNLKTIKTVKRVNLRAQRLDSFLRISEDGPDVDKFDATTALQLWANEKVRRPCQSQRKDYKQRQSKAVRIGSLSDSDSSSEEEVELFE